ncbi:SDR family NAD(P)-dependent oxidoreductase [Lichenicoccus sp.]|uniref:SDR family NAD(P)-dependent oxidoreductase n=1 Tax=Lichenicoccus sp. TaxID=2781899 RepID=UPI003D136484
MTEFLSGKAAFITGAGSGIGHATALVFAAEGAQVAVVDLSLEAAERTAGEIRASGGRSIAVAADVSVASQVASAVQQTVDAFGRLDCAFNNAGIHGSQLGVAAKPAAEITSEAFQRMVEVNLKGVWLCMKYQILQMQKQGGGAIVNTGSIGATVGLRGSSAYCACKHGVLGLTKTAALEFAKQKIRVNSVSPGYTDTPMMAESMQRKGAQVLAIVPLHRLAAPRDIGNTVAFLCSDDASYVSGCDYPVDGGFLGAR